ncbi:TPM domain-containing protein [candidate division KSB1 bacterium]|nr:TPM domain-containing protein [candidate division KSB1 bacterium]
MIKHLVAGVLLGLLVLQTGCSQKSDELYDRAGLLDSSERQRLTQWQKGLLGDFAVELGIVTLEKPADDLNRVADSLFQSLRLGQKTGGDRGVLLVIDPLAQRLRLEIGYDLEMVFTDAFVGRIENEQMVPFFLNDRIGAGIEATVELMVSRLSDVAGDSSMVATSDSPYFSGGAGAQTRVGEPAHGSEPPSLDPDVAPQPTPRAALEAYHRLLSAGSFHPLHLLLTPESRQFLQDRGVTRAQMRSGARLLDRVRDAGEIHIQEHRAVIRFDPSDRRAHPFFFHKTDSGWQLDLLAMNRVIGFNHRNEWFRRVANHPYAFALKDWRFDENGFPVSSLTKNP